MARITILAPLRHRSFRLLYSGQVISDLGDWLDFLALITLITFRWKLGAGALAALSVALILPSAFVAPFAGVFVDRWPRRAVMITCDLARAVVVLGLVWAPNLYSMLALVVAAGVFSTFFTPARQATIRSTVPEDDLLAANSLSQLSLQGTKVIGPALGGLIVAIASPQAAFIVDSLSFIVSAVLLSRLPRLSAVAPSSKEGAERPKRNFWSEYRAGITFIFQRRPLAIAVSSMAVAMFMIFTFDSLAALSLKELGLTEAYVGLAVGCIGLGTALGAAVVGQWGDRFHPLGLIGSGNLVSGILVALLGFGVILALRWIGPGWLPIWLLMGLSGAAIFVPYSYILQKETPPELIGRVSSTAGGLQTIFQVLAPPIGALVATWLGVGFVFAVAGSGLAVVGIVVLLLLPGVRAATVKENAGVKASVV